MWKIKLYAGLQGEGGYSLGNTRALTAIAMVSGDRDLTRDFKAKVNFTAMLRG